MAVMMTGGDRATETLATTKAQVGTRTTTVATGTASNDWVGQTLRVIQLFAIAVAVYALVTLLLLPLADALVFGAILQNYELHRRLQRSRQQRAAAAHNVDAANDDPSSTVPPSSTDPTTGDTVDRSTDHLAMDGRFDANTDQRADTTTLRPLEEWTDRYARANRWSDRLNTTAGRVVNSTVDAFLSFVSFANTMNN